MLIFGSRIFSTSVEQISFQYPSWWIILAVLGALLAAGLLYYKSKKLDEKRSWLKPSLYFLRFLPIFGIGLLLLGPLLKQLLEETKKPIVVVLNDDSRSIDQWIQRTSSEDPSTAVNNMVAALSEKYEVG